MTQIRGALIVVEGGDRSGKSTFCKGIVSELIAKGINAEYWNFPNRTTDTGKIIDKYLKTKDFQCNDETIHLLFSANRWEQVPKMLSLLNSGVTLVIDRYAFSGVAFSAAKGLNINWCKSPDIGLPRPDIVYFMNLDPITQSKRNGFGVERYESVVFQQKVQDCYSTMIDPTWKIIEASKSNTQLQNEEILSILGLLKDVQHRQVEKLWQDED